MSDNDTGQGTEPVPWHRALAYALCGTDLAGLPGRAGPDPTALARELAAEGWNRTALRTHAEQAREAGRPWPHPVPAEVAAQLPPAQFAAALRGVVTDWQLAPAARRVRTGRSGTSGGTGRRSAADERLLRDVPPHFGKL